MSIKTRELDPNLLEAAFYDKPFKFSYSSMNKVLTSPGIFYKEYVLKEREIQYGKHLLEGTVIHYLVLENQGFDDKFLVLSDNLPSDTNRLVADYCFEIYKEKDDDTLVLTDFVTEILDKLLEINKHQSLKDTKDGLGDDKRIAKIADQRTLDYFEFLKKKAGRIIIDSALLDKCTRRADIVKANTQMRDLLGLDLESDGRTYGVYNELDIDIDAKEGESFGYKGILDNMVVDVRNKTIRINDFKTTGKSLTDFSEAVEYWNYWLQAAMYVKLVRSFLSSVIQKDWTIEFRFIVFDKYDQLYAFQVTDETLNSWVEKMKVAEKEAEYHYVSKDFTLPYEYAQGDVKL
jgi:hypothetical protein